MIEPLLRDEGTLEVIVVVDGSTDGTAEWLASRAGVEPRLRFVVTSNQGGGRARQTGVEHARGSLVLLLDDDVIPSEGMVTGHRARHSGSEGLVVLGDMPIEFNAQGRDAWVVQRYREEYRRQRSSWQRDPGRILEHLWAGNFSLSRASIEAMGGLDPGVRMDYHTDLVCGLRAHDAGLRGIFAPELVAEHRYERDLDGFCRDCFRHGHDRAVLCDLFPERFGEVTPRGVVGTPPLTSRLYGWAGLAPSRLLLGRLLRWVVRWASVRRQGHLLAVGVRHLAMLETAAGIRAGLRRPRPPG